MKMYMLQMYITMITISIDVDVHNEACLINTKSRKA